MSTYSISDLLALWRKDQLSVEQAIGYLLQNLLALFQWRAEVEKRLRQLEQPPAKPPAA